MGASYSLLVDQSRLLPLPELRRGGGTRRRQQAVGIEHRVGTPQGTTAAWRWISAGRIAHQPRERQPPARGAWGAGPPARTDAGAIVRDVATNGPAAPTRARSRGVPRGVCTRRTGGGGAILPHTGHQGQGHGIGPAGAPGCPRVRRGIRPSPIPPPAVAIAARRAVCGGGRTGSAGSAGVVGRGALLPRLDGAKAAAGQYHGGTLDDLPVAQRHLNALLP
jgi:hypothetical protein